MPTKKVAEKQRAKDAVAKVFHVAINLRPYNVVFQVLLSQLSIIPYFTAYIASMGASNCINLNGFHPIIFNIFVQWLVLGHIWPLQDHAITSTTTTSDVLNITFAWLLNASLNSNTYVIAAARKLYQAYFMAQDIRLYHLIDAIINLIIRHLHMDSPLLLDHVRQMFGRSSPGLHGLKRLLVVAYIWANCISNGQVPGLADYLPDFQAHVAATLKDIRTAKYVFDAANPSSSRNRETVDVEINFQRP
jgi:hypothetical protein